MKKKQKNYCIFTIIVVLCICTLLKVPVNADTNEPSPTIVELANMTAPSAILIEPTTKTVLFEKDAHEKRACGSVTKIMSILLFMEALDNGKMAKNDIVTISEFAKSMGGSEIWLEVGEQMTVDDLLKAVCIQSANDATVALAEQVAGNESAFLQMMNDKAKSLGMNDTHFLNTTGFDEDGQFTTAYDISLMASELISHPTVFEYCQIWQTELRGGKTQLSNTNKLLKTYNGITGLKTGTTDKAKNCFCGTAMRDGMSLVSVVLGCETSKERFSSTSTLLDYGFNGFTVANPVFDENELPPIPVLEGMQKQVALTCKIDGQLLVSKGKENDITHTVNIAENIVAPVESGQKVGTVVYKLDDKDLATFDIFTSECVEKISFGKVFEKLFQGLCRI